jgi:hypothetical protein
MIPNLNHTITEEEMLLNNKTKYKEFSRFQKELVCKQLLIRKKYIFIEDLTALTKLILVSFLDK